MATGKQDPSTVPAEEIATRVAAGAQRAVATHGWQGATLARIAEESGLSRMTLHRRGLGRDEIFALLASDYERDFRETLEPALAGEGTALERLPIDELDTCGASRGSTTCPIAGSRHGALPRARRSRKPLLLEGEAGVGKTEAAKALATALGAADPAAVLRGPRRREALYEWNYARQLLHIRAAQEGTLSEAELFGPRVPDPPAAARGDRVATSRSCC
jgi:AcrR family transcriptional regulator